MRSRGYFKKGLNMANKLLIPINERSSHWTLVVVDPGMKKIDYYDSYRNDGSAVMEAILDFLQEEHQYSASNFDRSSWNLESIAYAPLQSDGSSCGPMVILTAESIGLEKPISHTQDDVRNARKQMQYILITEAIEDIHEN